MHRPDVCLPFARRSFLSRLGTGLATLGAALGADTASTYAQGASDQRWQAARHAEDDWFDKLPGKHRMILDAVSGQGAGDALHFASNVLTTSKSGYGLDSGDLAVGDQSTHGYAGGFARTTDGKADAVYKELTSNLIGNSHMVPSGIVAVGHAQERGYAYAYCG